MESSKKEVKSNEYKLKETIHNTKGDIIASKGNAFFLSDGFYYSEDNKVILESNNDSRKFMEFIQPKDNKNDSRKDS